MGNYANGVVARFIGLKGYFRMNKWITKFSFVVAFTGVCLSAVSSVQAWQLPVEIAVSSDTGDKTYIKVVVGLEKGATDGFDNLWDTPALVSHPDPDRDILLNAYVHGKERKGETGRLWKDIRGVEKQGNTEWVIKIDPLPEGKVVSLQWTVPVGMFNAGERLVLKDNNNLDKDGKPAETNVLNEPGYEFNSDGGGEKTLSMVYSKDSSGSSSGGGSGFGCGTVKDRGGDNGGRGTIDIIALILFSSFILRFIRKYCLPVIPNSFRDLLIQHRLRS